MPVSSAESAASKPVDAGMSGPAEPDSGALAATKPSSKVCGNDVREGTELCDGADCKTAADCTSDNACINETAREWAKHQAVFANGRISADILRALASSAVRRSYAA
jgi:hypothetical protein